MGPIKIVNDSPKLVIAISALLIILIASILVVSSRSSSDIDIYDQEENTGQELLTENSHIAGWSSLDRDSTHIGETVNFSINIIYNSMNVTPDIEAFERSVDVMPLEKVRFNEMYYSLGEGVDKYILDYTLQVVNIEIDRTYQLDPSTIYYTVKDEAELKSLQISSPVIHTVSYYPADVSVIELKEIKGRVYGNTYLTRIVLTCGGLILLSLCLLTIWKFCRRKRRTELSQADRLWLEYQNTDNNVGDHRSQLSNRERIFTRLLEGQTKIKPGMFWAGREPEDKFWTGITEKARRLLRSIYRPAIPEERDLESISKLLDEAFSFVLSEEKRKILSEPNIFNRLISQRNTMLLTTGCLIFGLLMLIFAIWPRTWVPQNIQHYNELIEVVENEEYKDEIATEFTELGEEFNDGSLKAASYYNSGTLMADNVQLISEDQMVSVGDVFSDVAADERIIQDAEDLLEILTLNVDIFRKSELQLRESVRADSNDENIRRNLELVIKRRQAALKMISLLLDTGHIQQVQLDEMLNLLESQMALEFEVEEGKEAPGYYIGEDF